MQKYFFTFILFCSVSFANEYILFFKSNDVYNLQQKVNQPQYSNIWNDILTDATDYCDTNSSRYADPDYFITNSNGDSSLGHHLARQLSTWLESIGFAYVITNNQSFGEHGVELLMSAVQNQPVTGEVMNTAFAGARGDMMRALSIGLDFFSDKLTVTQRDEVAKVARDYILDFIDEFDNSSTWWNKYHNYLGVCGGGSGMLALTISNDFPNNISTWIGKSKESVLRLLNNGYDTNGAGFEGALYVTYGLGNAIIFGDALNRYNNDQSVLTNETLNQVPYYYASILLPGDSVFDARNDSLYRSNFSGNGFGSPFFLLMASGYNGIVNTNNIAAWLWQKTGSSYNKFLQIIWGNPIVTNPPDINSLIKKPLGTRFPKRGLCVWRTGWEKNDVMFSIEAGEYHKTTHNQADKGHFNLHGLGYKWALDAGYGNNNTDPSNRCTTLAHSCILIDGKGQANSGAGLGTNGKILNYTNLNEFGYALADAKAAYITNSSGTTSVPVTKALRHVFFVRATNDAPAYAVVLDDIQVANETHDFTWQMTTDRNMNITFSNNVATITPLSSGVTPTMKIYMNATGQFTYSSDIFYPYDGRTPTSFLKLKADITTVNPRFAAVLVPLPIGAASPNVIFTQENNKTTIKILWDKRIDKITWNDQAVMSFNDNDSRYVDNPTLQLLMHCDETNHPNSWLLCPDDNSSGRDYNQPLLDKALTSWSVDTATIPTITTGSPYAGSYLHFDGISNNVYVSPGWTAASNVICDFSMRWFGYPPANDDYASLIQTKSWRAYMRRFDASTCRVGFLIGDTWLYSSTHLQSNHWYEVHFSVMNNVATIIIADSTNSVAVELPSSSSQITIGNDIYRLTSRLFYGDIDEIRIGAPPFEYATFIDNSNVQLLLHCDKTNHPFSWLITPDDNSSGREVNQVILDRAVNSWSTNATTIPTLKIASPYGGNYFHFDGTSDSMYISPGWQAKGNVFCDFSLRWLGYPPSDNPYAALVQAKSWRSYLRPAGATTCRVGFLISGTWINSTKYLASNTWYNVHLSLINDNVILIVGDTTNTTAITFTDQDSQMTIGNDIFREDDRYFYGDIDEIRVGAVPEAHLTTFIFFLFSVRIFRFVKLMK